MAKLTRLEDQHLLKTISNFPAEIQADDSWRTFLLSLAIVKYYFGEEWVEKYVMPSDEPGFLRQDNVDQVRSEEQSFRIVDFAELLFNLQNVDGFDDCIARMKQGLIEPTYAELDLGRMLYLSEIAFRFVIPKGKRGDNYDIEIILPEWPIVCADAKCKIESTEFSAATVRNSLDTARKQFPANYPSIVFVKVPPQWGRFPAPVNDILAQVAQEFMRGTGRIVSVKYFTSYIVWRDGGVTHTHRFKEYSNPANRFDKDRNWDMFVEADETATPNSFGELSNIPSRWRRLIYYPFGLVK
jgi:hypothetical protein